MCRQLLAYFWHASFLSGGGFITAQFIALGTMLTHTYMQVMLFQICL